MAAYRKQAVDAWCLGDLLWTFEILLCDFKSWRAVLLTVRMDPYRTRSILGYHQRGLDRGIVVLVVRFNQGSGGVDRERQAEGCQVLRVRNVTVKLEDVEKAIVELFLCCQVREAALSDPI